MLETGCLGINEHGHLTIGGMDTIQLAEQFGTPVYVMDEDEIRRSCRSYKHSIENYYNGHGRVLFASKAFICKEMCKLVMEEGLGLDVVSGGELYTALSVGFPVQNIYFHGNNKTPQELTYAVDSGVGQIVVDNIFELEMLEEIALAAGKKVDILFRIKPGVEAHTHKLIRTGGIDSKFGFAMETGEAFAAITRAVEMKGVRLVGLHCHIGSQIFDVEPFQLAAQVMLELIGKIKQELSYEIKQLNLGGGFGIQYLPEHDVVEYDRYMKQVSGIIKDSCTELGIEMPFILMEPGRSIVGPAGITLYKVGSIKEIPGVRTYVSVDGGMTDNPRPALYDAVYTMEVANKASEAKTQIVTVAGRCCESDTLASQIPLQPVSVGDTIAVLATGAYNYTQASNYNRLPKPPVVMVKDGKARVVVRRETYEDLLRFDI